jgi:thymidylate kinase
MTTVALIGPDGAGKTTTGRRIQQDPTLPVKYVYLGINLEASNLVLPTTRLLLEIKRALGGRPDMSGPSASRTKPRPANPLKRLLSEVKSGLRMANQLAEEWFRQGVIWYYERRGYIVLVDRHFLFDYYFYDIVPGDGYRPLSSRLHGFVLNRLYPRPDLVIFLDAPAEVLFARKGEGTVEIIERRRQEYLHLRHLVKHFVTVDATQPEEAVVREVADLIRQYSQIDGGVSEAAAPRWLHENDPSGLTER